MAAYNKFNIFVQDIGRKVHNLNVDTCKVYLSNTTPNAATMSFKSDLAEFAGGTGYTAGGSSVTGAYSQTAGTASMTGVDVVWTAGAADWNQFRYVVLYNSSSGGADSSRSLIAWWDYGTGLTLGNGETFTVDFGSSIFTLA